jgi:hypothetical protein
MRSRRAWAISGAASVFAVGATATILGPGCSTHQCDSSNATFDGGLMIDPTTYVTNNLDDDWVPYAGQETLHVLFPPGIGRTPVSVEGWSARG